MLFTDKINKNRAHERLRNNKPPIVIGVHSGMGPIAGYAFSERLQTLIAKRYAGDKRGDKAHPEIITYSDSQTPKRDKSIGREKALLKHLMKGIDFFKRARADFILAPCNTLMHFKDKIEQSTGVHLVDIITTTAKYTKEHHPNVRKVGLLATKATAQNGRYINALTSHNAEMIISDKLDLDRIDEIIADLKSGVHLKSEAEKDALLENIRPIVERLEQKGAEAIILGCTELPLLLNQSKTPAGTPLISSIEALAQEGVKRLAELEKRYGIGNDTYYCLTR